MPARNGPAPAPALVRPVRLAWERPLVPARVIRKVSRFAAWVEIDGREEYVAIPNTGRLAELIFPGNDVLLRPAANPARKTRYDLLLCRRKRSWVCVEAVRANHLMRAAFETGAFGGALDYRSVKPEHRLGRSRFDFLLEGGRRPILVEVKAVTLEEDGIARFPDAPTDRGRRHLVELLELRERGFDTMVVLVALLSFARRFAPADATDPDFGETLRAVSAEGLPVWALASAPRRDGIALRGPLAVDFEA